MRDRWWIAGFLAVATVVGVLLAHGLAMVVDPVLVWGGYRCETASGLTACAGYPPVGLTVALAVAVVAIRVAWQPLVRVRRLL